MINPKTTMYIQQGLLSFPARTERQIKEALNNALEKGHIGQRALSKLYVEFGLK